MPLLKAQKKELAKTYLTAVEGARNTVILSLEGIPVNEINAVRSDIYEANGQLQIVKKRVFMKSLEGKLEGLTLEKAPGAIAVLYSHNEDDMHAPLKVISKHTKLWKKEKHEFGFDYVGGWYDSVWQDKEYVAELANLPSKEELIGQFLYMLNHPVSSFARVLQAIADKDPSENAGDSPEAKEAQAETAAAPEAKAETEESTSEETES